MEFPPPSRSRSRSSRLCPSAMKTNRAWHARHPMPERATIAERVRWHVAHAKYCGCRPMPATVKAALAAGTTSQTKSPLGVNQAGAERQLRAFIGKFDAKDQRLIRSVRAAMRRRLPTAHELVWDNYNFFVIGYSPTEKPTDAPLSI